ncbi:MAG: HEAT repeat domain-containing protein [Elusimicrobia bacterium]|nr:HEAT repeat domain-containing protein [Elusimicrobiota bacterium]
MRLVLPLAIAVLLTGPAAAQSLLDFQRALQSIHKAVWEVKQERRRAQAKTDSRQEELLRLLDDGDPSVRAEAAKALKNHLGDPQVQKRLLEVLDRYGELDRVRREIIKSLSAASPYYSVQDRLVAAANSPSESSDIRSVALKSLFPVAVRYDIRERVLIPALEDGGRPLIERRAAAWALFANAADIATQQALLRVARNAREPDAFRVEAIKSLALGMPYWAVQDPIFAIARDSGEPASVREPAILCFAMIGLTPEQLRFLRELARNESDSALRQAAIKSLGGLTVELARYFHFAYYGDKFLDPLEDQ